MNETKITLQETLSITDEHAAVQGHFPGLPIYPGVAQIQDVCDLLTKHFGRPVNLVQLDRTKFLSLVQPPAALHLICNVIGQKVSWEMTNGTNVASRGQGLMTPPTGETIS